ncbi:MAG: methyltransferase, partial [Acidobacteriota bacterium]
MSPADSPGGEPSRDPGSFRDPSGFVFTQGGRLYRQVDQSYAEHYDRLMASGLYDRLVGDRLLIPHVELSEAEAAELAVDVHRTHRVLRPEVIPLVSYPYEWCPGQLRDAALLTLEVARRALEHDMVLKDASAYNVQFVGRTPVFIDTLSFEGYVEGEPWVAYRQFCQHFLAPLALMAYRDPRLATLLRVHIDGVSLELADALLPWTSRLRFGLWMHLRLPAKAERRELRRSSAEREKRGSRPVPRVSRNGLMGLLSSLESTVRSLRWRPKGTVWGDYYDATNYTDTSRSHKERLVAEMLAECGLPATGERQPRVWDLGANTGPLSRLAADAGATVVSWDIDVGAVERHYRALGDEPVDAASERPSGGYAAKILPLVLDLANPSPGLGWANNERQSLLDRAAAPGGPDAVMALARIHHLAIGNNVPLPALA